MPRRLTAIVLSLLGLAILFAVPLLGAKHETWFEVRSPNFIVVSNAGEKQARKTAIRFEQIRAVFRRSLTVASAHTSPTITILAVKDEDSVRALLPEYWAKGHTHPAGIFLQNMNQYFAVVQLDAPGSNPYDPIYHEYYHSLTLPYYPNLPLWVAEGLAEFYGNTQISDSEVGMGRPDPDLIAELKQGGFIPLDVLFKVDHSSPYYNEQNKTTMFYAESWALTHYLMAGDKAAHKQMLVTYLDALSHGATQEEAAAKGFGDLQQLQAALYRYIQNYVFYYLKSPPPPEIPSSDLQVRELTDAEVDAYRGGFAAVRGRTQDAKPILEQAVKLDPKLALAYQYLGFAEFEDGERAEALADFTRAIALNPKNALTRFLRAYLASTQAGTIGNDAQMEEDLHEAIADSPEFAPPYGMLSVYLAIQGQNLPEALTFAKKAVTLEPGNAAYQFDLAQVLARMLRYDDARAAALSARANSRDPAERQQADQFLAFLRQDKELSAGDSEAADSGEVTRGSVTTTPSNSSANSKNSAKGDATSDAAGAPLLREATGTVTKSSCMDGMKFEMATDAGTLTLHIKPGANLQIRLATRPTGPFNPCKAVQGQRVRVEYQADDAKAKTGTVQSLTVLSGPSDDAGNQLDSASARRLDIGSAHNEPVTSSAEGNVTQVLCNGNELIANLDAGEGTFILHARDATRVEYQQDVAFDTGEFHACSQLKGHQAKITFVAVDGKTYDGEIQSVEVLK